ncbi:MAG: hypothetical protein H7Y31_14645 [Chitinophagaceae bacterium]|nr:hypothetical protein [Chitinophagaceae bacterium]
MKYSQWIGIVATILLVISCFMPWAYYPDIDKNFTGFFSEDNSYGKPGKVIMVLAAFAVLFFAVQKIWAKRWNLFISALVVAYAIKSFILFGSCYGGICPEKQVGIWLMLFSSILMMIMAVFPQVSPKKNTGSPINAPE